jgi:SAM-dependent methyltransferase
MDSGADTAGYTTDIVYPSAFGVFQAPVHLASAVALARRAAPAVDGRPFAYCDLGTGAGLTLCVLADCYPEAQFHGVDINPEHVRRARALAAEAGLANVQFHEAGFDALQRLDLPTFDFIALGGVYSWLAPELRRACLDFANARLAERGAVFVHYGALPGNAQVDALYSLLRQAADAGSGDSLARFGEAVRLLRGLRAAKARFFEHNPYAAAWLDQLEGQDPRAMAHEALNAQRASLWAGDVAAEAQAAGLAFVANAQLEMNDLCLCAPEALRDELSRLPRTTREMTLDALRNANSRMDVLMREAAPAEDAPPSLWLDRLTRGPLEEERRTLSQRARCDVTAPAYAAVLAEVDGVAAVALPDLLASPRLAGVADLRTVVERLVALKLLNVLRRPYVRGAAPAMRVSKLNAMVLEERVEAAGALPIASPVAGTQLLMPLEDRLAVLAMLGGDFDGVWRRLEARGRKVVQAGRPVTSAADLKAVAGARAGRLGQAMRERLAGLGVLV